MNQKIPCPYCRAQGLRLNAEVQKQKAAKEGYTRYGCINGHFFAVPDKAQK